jgi:hypothetical protein
VGVSQISVSDLRFLRSAFQVGDLVWKTILPIGTRDNRFGKWSPSWEGPYRIAAVVSGNAYFVETLERQGLAKALNGKYLKRYFPSVWQGARWPMVTSCREAALQGWFLMNLSQRVFSNTLHDT